MQNIKRIDIKEFRELGFLQELNRQLLHPMGLALEIIVDDNGKEKLGGIWDYRDDPCGIIYDLEKSDSDRIIRFQKNADYIENHIGNMIKSRIDTLGYGVENIPTIEETKSAFDKYIDLDAIRQFESYLRNPDNNFKEEFDKIKFEFITDEDISARLIDIRKTFFTLLYINEETKQGFTKTYQFDNYDIDVENMRIIKIKK